MIVVDVLLFFFLHPLSESLTHSLLPQIVLVPKLVQNAWKQEKPPSSIAAGVAPLNS